ATAASGDNAPWRGTYPARVPGGCPASRSASRVRTNSGQSLGSLERDGRNPRLGNGQSNDTTAGGGFRTGDCLMPPLKGIAVVKKATIEFHRSESDIREPVTK